MLVLNYSRTLTKLGDIDLISAHNLAQLIHQMDFMGMMEGVGMDEVLCTFFCKTEDKMRS